MNLKNTTAYSFSKAERTSIYNIKSQTMNLGPGKYAESSSVLNKKKGVR